MRFCWVLLTWLGSGLGLLRGDATVELTAWATDHQRRASEGPKSSNLSRTQQISAQDDPFAHLKRRASGRAAHRRHTPLLSRWRSWIRIPHGSPESELEISRLPVKF